MATTQIELDFMLPEDEQQRRAEIRGLRAHWYRMVESIEQIGELTPHQRRKVIGFVKRLLKSDITNWRGVGTFRQSYLAREWVVSERAMRYWMAWSKQLGVIDWTVDADESGVRRTTIEFTWTRLAAKLGTTATPARMPETADQPASTAPDQPATITDQPATRADQPATRADQPATIAAHPVVGYRLTGAPGTRTHACARGAVAAVDLDDRPPGWSAAWSALERLGVHQKPLACRYASQRGLSPRQVVEACQTAEANAWRFHDGAAAGVVFYLRHGAWPVPQVQSVDEIDARVAAATREQAQQQASDERDAENDRTRQRQSDALERTRGPALDALSLGQLRQLTARLPPATRDFLIRDVHTARQRTMARQELLRAMDDP